MLADLFVFGTLKRGYPLHDHGLRGAQFIGIYRTQQRLPLLIAGRWFAPMMFNEPGNGHKVLGEVYRIEEFQLPSLDRIESIGEPGNLRLKITVEPVGDGKPLSAFVYMKSRELTESTYHSGIMESYGDHRFIAPWDR
ncbi:gamma-glutamylcyclotransferase [Bradyrhizobium sp. CCGB12]|uniref:gamma-glutamylcyclotransferase family protein n=1 Tax=Bradyrhizobium sp. CCGB12 TaxID=2949632 RepID=UPI0020B3570A|nr:gamma-glutamylcyclotransferase family protein [Bradyrhizobium sp. CCGB12]MCP3395271.1 gamma-glutamylcyclotransferase [Bradyrhizobium sp. CCGB12]